uniref:Uncharacterized protein n=1 Tax=Amphimedon queenslandica TaxID=400682 RepID=A0A1X7SKS3_AMPQE
MAFNNEVRNNLQEQMARYMEGLKQSEKPPTSQQRPRNTKAPLSIKHINPNTSASTSMKAKPVAAITPLSSTALTSPPPKSSTVLSRQATVPPLNFNTTSSSTGAHNAVQNTAPPLQSSTPKPLARSFSYLSPPPYSPPPPPSFHQTTPPSPHPHIQVSSSLSELQLKRLK